MGKKPGDTKIGGIKSSIVKPTDTAKEVAGAEAVSEVGEVAGIKATSAVGGTKAAGAAGRRRATRTMTLQEREHLLQMVQEEAEKMFANSALSAERKKTVADAVKMAIDAGLIQEDEKKK
jgi:hypothetical protein